MLKFLKRLGSSWWLLVLLVFCTIIQVFMDFSLPTCLGRIIAMLQDGSGIRDIFATSFEMVLIALLSGISSICVGKLASVVTAKMMARVRYELFAKVSDFSTNEMNKFSISSLITRTTNDITNVSNTFNFAFRYILYGPFLAIAALIFLMRQGSLEMTLLVLGAVILLGIIMFILIKVAIPRYRSIQEKTDHVNLVTRENLEGLRVVRAYNAEKYQEEKFEKVNDDLMRTDRFASRALGFLSPAIMFIVGSLNVGIYLLGSHLIPDGKLDYSQMTVVSQYAMLLLTGFVLMTVIIVQVPRSIVCAKRIHEVLDTDPIVKANETSKKSSEVGTIEFKDVSFTYPGSEVPVIENISFRVEKGQTVAFIGATGAGKTTLINLIPRFFDCTKGEVLVDGLNVKDFSFDDLFNKFGYVPQKGYLFHDSLRSNVCLGRPDATDEEFNRALDISQSTDFVNNLPNKEMYEISQGGKNVSGGQRQRLSIARAIITRPEIFIFDDSFSALDYKTDKVLRGEIKTKCKGVTSVIVAQRVGTIIDADEIIVLDNGKMVGKGTHQELLKNCAVYKEIALSQLSKEELGQ